MPEQRRFVGTASELHALPMPTQDDPTPSGEAELWIMEPTSLALAMGSSQKPETFDQIRLREDDVELAPRRSGGGAVFIDPASTVWIDLVAPRSSAFWSADLAENFLLVGRIWQQALRTLGLETDLCIESPGRTDASSLACWAGVGWGELTVRLNAAGSEQGDVAKIVGLSQRRTRWGSRVQAMAVLDGSSARVGDYLSAADQAIVSDVLHVHDVGLSTAIVEAAILQEFSTR